MSTTDSQILERQPGKGIQLQLALDDAFAEGDDQPIEFSSVAVRKHFVEQEQWAVVEETSSVDEPNTSISTFYLDGSASLSASGSHTPVDDLSEPDRHDHAGQEELAHIDVSRPPLGCVSVVAQAENGAAASDRTRYPRGPSPRPSPLDLPTMTTSSSPPTVPPPQSHRPLRSTGPTMFQKVVSKTRPHFLPPKSRQEDLKHIADWEAMMKQSQVAGKPGSIPLTISSH